MYQLKAMWQAYTAGFTNNSTQENKLGWSVMGTFTDVPWTLPIPGDYQNMLLCNICCYFF